MKLKDYDGTLEGLKISLNKEVVVRNNLPCYEMYIKGGWHLGLWLSKEVDSERIHPATFETYEEICNLEVTK